MKPDIVDAFREDFNWMQRQSKGLYPWLEKNRWEFLRRITNCGCDGPWCRGPREGGRSAIAHFLSTQIHENPLIDLFQKALVRAEARFVSRYIPQRSNEERLTGNLVSELDAAVFLARSQFRAVSKERYNVEKEIDFFYYDLSRGGKVEKHTGADLGLVIVVDLPDYPLTVRGLIMQAKKVDPHASVSIPQFRTIQKTADNSSQYLFYDMNSHSLASPIVFESSAMERKADENEKKGHKSFSLTLDDILNGGIPLSLYVPHDVIGLGKGQQYKSFRDAFECFRQMPWNQSDADGFSGRLAIASIGKPISYEVNSDGGLDLSV
jgi:hypothetical protein